MKMSVLNMEIHFQLLLKFKAIMHLVEHFKCSLHFQNCFFLMQLAKKLADDWKARMLKVKFTHCQFEVWDDVLIS